MSALWGRLITHEKLLFKSLTMYLAAAIAAAPTLLDFLQQNFPSVAPYLPQVLQQNGVRWIALGIFLCRLRSMVKPPPPAPA